MIITTESMARTRQDEASRNAKNSPPRPAIEHDLKGKASTRRKASKAIPLRSSEPKIEDGKKPSHRKVRQRSPASISETAEDGQLHRCRKAGYFRPAPARKTIEDGQISASRKANRPQPASILEQAESGHSDDCREATLHAPASADETIAAIRRLHADDRFLIKAATRESLAIQSYIRRSLGWTFDSTAAEKKKIRAKSTAVFKQMIAVERKRVKHGIPDDAIIPSRIRSLLAIKRQRGALSVQLVKLTEALPVAEWSAIVRGFGIRSLATIIGECGDIGSYRNRDCLVKRLGIAPPDAYLMKDTKGKEFRAIPRERRSVLWIIGDNLIKSGNAVYKAIYAEQKKRRTKLRSADFKARPAIKGLKGHIHKQAHRAMERRFVRDLYAAWKAAGQTTQKEISCE